MSQLLHTRKTTPTHTINTALYHCILSNRNRGGGRTSDIPATPSERRYFAFPTQCRGVATGQVVRYLPDHFFSKLL